MTAIYVLTCARPVDDGENPWPYVYDTCAGIAGEGLDVPHVLFVDGARPPGELQGQANEEGPLWQVFEWERPHMALKGNKLPYFAVLEHAFDSGFEDVVIFEDDVRFCANAVRRMVTFPIPRDVALVQFFAPHVNIAPYVFPGLWRAPSTSFQFCQAVKYKRATLAKLVEWSGSFEFGKFTASDQAVNLALERLGLRYAVHTPDLVDHVGDVSTVDEDNTIGPTSGRVSKNFPDPKFDALRLFDLDVKYR